MKKYSIILLVMLIPSFALAQNFGGGEFGSPDMQWKATAGGNINRASGNVGVGTANPGTKLDVNGTVRATAFSGDGSALTGISSPWTRNSPNVYPTTITDNIGVGTVTPSAELEVESTAANDLFMVSDNGPGDTSPFVIDQGGNVGVGSATPGAKMDFQGNVRVFNGNIGIGTALATHYLWVVAPNAGDGSSNGVMFQGNSLESEGGVQATVQNTNAAGKTLFNVVDQLGGGFLFQRWANSATGTVTGIAAKAGLSLIETNTSGPFVIGHQNAAQLQFATNRTLGMTLDAVQNVGIGTVGAVDKLQVLGGSIRAAGYKSSDGTAGVTVTTCTGYKNGLCISGT